MILIFTNGSRGDKFAEVYESFWHNQWYIWFRGIVYPRLRPESHMPPQSAGHARAELRGQKPVSYTHLTGVSFIRRFFMKDGSVRTNPGNDPNVVREEGEPDNTLTVIRVEDLDGKLIAVVTNYGVHLDTVGGTKICADYPGVLSERIKESYGKDVVSLFLTGPCGNTNHINIKDPSSCAPDRYRQIGNAMFEKARLLIDGVRTEPKLQFVWRRSGY